LAFACDITQLVLDRLHAVDPVRHHRRLRDVVMLGYFAAQHHDRPGRADVDLLQLRILTRVVSTAL